MRARHRFTLLAIGAAVALLAWGAFVTSIDAGMAVPDWPTSFSSFDPFNPWPEWWTITPVLAEHGHRLAGALVGLFTLALAVWTWLAEGRPWVRRAAVAALALVIAQGVLGGLRVVWISAELAVVHACVAQIFFALLAALALFTSDRWDRLPGARPTPDGTDPLRIAGLLAAGMVYVQIILGALLRHPGTGIDPTYAVLHISGAVLVLGLVSWHALLLRRELGDVPAGRTASRTLFVLLALQVALGLIAYFVLLDERGMLRPSNVQVVVNSLHLVFGAALFAGNVLGVLIRRRAAHAPHPASNVPITA